jgi:hypothetical protein
MSAFLELSGDSFCCFGKIHFIHLHLLIGSDHAYILRSMLGESELPLW